MTSEASATLLLLALAAHLMHHRVARREISHVEGVAALVAALPTGGPIPEWLLCVLHVSSIAVLALGSLGIASTQKRITP